MPVINQGLLGSKYMNMMPTLGAGAWSPANLSSTQLLQWLDATDESTVTLNGSNVSQLNDKSGNDKHAQQAVVAYQPIYVTSGELNYMEHEGTTDYLTSPSVTDLNGVTSFFIFATVHFSQDLLQASNRYAFRMWGNNTPFASPSNPNQVYRNGNLVNVTNSVEGLDEFRRGVDNIQIGEMRGMNFDDSIWRDNNWNYGGSGGGFQFEDRLYEIIHLAPEATLEDILRTEGYLAWKYGLEGDLPPAHPYKNSAPTSENVAYSPFISGANVILDFQNTSSVTLNGSNISEVTNQASTEIGDFEQTNAVQQPLYNTNDSDAGGYKTMDTDDGVSTKQGLEAQDSITFGDIYFAMTYKDGADSSFDSFSNLISDPVTVANRILGNNGSSDLFTGTVFTSELEANGNAASNTALPMPFSIVRAANSTPASGQLDLFFVESSGSRDWEGSLAYMAIFPEKLNTENSDKVTGYLSHEFELTDSLALGHPYKTSRPKTSSPAFSPWQYNPILWIKSDSQSITLNGADVSGIEDRGRFRNNSSQGSAANQPLFDPINERMVFDGTEFLQSGNIDTFKALHESGGTIAAKFNLSEIDSNALMALFTTQEPTSGDKGIFLGIDDRSSAENAAYIIVGRGIFGTANVAYETSTGSYNLPISDTEDHTLIVTFDATNMKIYLDGTLQYTVTPKNPFATGSSSDPGAIGADTSGDWGHEGGIAELIAFEEKLDDAEALQLHNYLTN